MFLQTLITHPQTALVKAVIVVASVTLHELAHGGMAMLQGDNTPRLTRRLTLNPIVHLDWSSVIFFCIAGFTWGRMSLNPSKFRHGSLSSLLVYAAGPLANLAIALFCIGLMNSLQAWPLMAGWLQPHWLHRVAQINLVLFLFNLLPIPPLDGFYLVTEFLRPLHSMRDSPVGLLLLTVLFLGFSFGDSLLYVADRVILVAAANMALAAL